jgi:transposase
VRLTRRQRVSLRALVRAGRHASRTITRARILLAAHERRSDSEIVAAYDVDRSTVVRVRRRFAKEGLDAALRERTRSGAPRKLSITDEAVLAATACTDPPRGYARWTLVMLAKRLVRLTAHDAIGKDTVRRRLAEMETITGKRGGSVARSATFSGRRSA